MTRLLASGRPVHERESCVVARLANSDVFIAAHASPKAAMDTWRDAERALIAVADAFHGRARLTEAEFADLRRRYDD
jgi:hypothetical protein